MTSKDEKCEYLKSIGVDPLNYRTEADLYAAMKAKTAATGGMDIYWDNVGGEILDGALEATKPGSRIVVCGRLSDFASPGYKLKNWNLILKHALKLEGFIVLSYRDKWGQAMADIGKLHAQGKLDIKEDISYGLENAPACVNKLLSGESIGKVILTLDQKE